MNLDNHEKFVLLIESNPDTANLVRASLTDARDGPFPIESAASLHAGLERLSQGGISAILLNLYLSDSQGFDTFEKLYQVEQQIPILILSDLAHEEIAKLAMQNGAKDYLLTGHIDGYSLSRAIRSLMERKSAEDALFLEKERAQITLNSIGDAVISTDMNGNVTFLNPAAERMTGWANDEAKGQPFAEVFQLFDGATGKRLPNPMDLAVVENKPVGIPVDSLLRRRDGAKISIEDSAAPIRDHSGRVTGSVIVFRDISKANLMAVKMSHLAQHDDLTDLPNRILLNDRLSQAISVARRRRQRLAVLFLDVDGFKHINDSLGHLIGDKLLQSIAQRLTACIRGADTVSRQGGDEFVVLLVDIEEAKAAAISASNILSALTEKHRIAEHELVVTLSIGISIFPDDGEDTETLLKNADAAMYHAKAKGRNNYQFFKQEMNDRAVERQSLEGSLRQALTQNEFVVHYQPKVDLKTGAILGAEALIRWLHPHRGLIYPDQFVSIAEDSGLIVPMGQWVLREACRQAQAWNSVGFPPTPIAVNISAVEFRQEGFLADVRSILQETGLHPGYLEIELTESVLVENVEATLTILKGLKDLGVQLAIDDFGTGYSSLSYLRQFPIDTLKIDQSFVRDIANNNGDATIVSAVIGMGNSLNLRVTAEGVETREQLAFLQSAHCEEGQGFYFSHGLQAKAFTRLLGAARPRYSVN